MKILVRSRKHHDMAGVIVLLLAVVMIAGMVGCEPATRYSLSISSTEGGSVTTPGEQTFTYSAGEVVDLVAEADEGYTFVNWAGDVADIADVEDATTTITVKGDCSITAHFAVKRYDLTISSTEGGSVPTPGEGTLVYDHGTVVNLVAEADEGYTFVNWAGDVADIASFEDATTTVTMKDDYSITAHFAVKQYSLTISSTEGGSVTTPGEGTFTYDYGTVVNLVAVAGEGYQFVRWTGDLGSIADTSAASTSIIMHGHYSVTADFGVEIWDWYDLDAIRGTPGGSYVLMNDLDSSTAGYMELASPTANGGKGWQPIGTLDDVFNGLFDGQGYEIRDLFIYRPDWYRVGLFRLVEEGGIIHDLGVVNADVTGSQYVGCLTGLLGYKGGGTVSNSYSSGRVSGDQYVGGLLGMSSGTVSNSYSSASVTGKRGVGGLVGWNGRNSTVSNSHYCYDEVLINGKNVITTGALFTEDFEQWLANGRFLDVNERLSQEDGYYVVNNVSDFKQLLAFGQDGSLKFRLKADLDLVDEPDFYIPYLEGEFDGNGHRILNLSFDFDSVSQVGLFGYLAPGGEVTQLGVEDLDITGCHNVGGLLGANYGAVSNSYCIGAVTGRESSGGLVGHNCGVVSNSYSAGSLTGGELHVGGLVGLNYHGTVTDSYAEGSVTAERQAGGLVGTSSGGIVRNSHSSAAVTGDFAIGGLLGVNGWGSHVNNCYSIGSVTGVDYVGGLAGLNDADSTVSDSYADGNVTGSDTVGGLVAWNVGTVRSSSATGDVTGDKWVGGLVGENEGTVSDSYATGSVSGKKQVGGLLGRNHEGAVRGSYSTGSVAGESWVGGLVGVNYQGTVRDSYANGSVTGDDTVGGLAGWSDGTISNCYATGTVVTGGPWVGGLVGENDGMVSDSYATGSVTGGDLHVGGLVGINYYGAVSGSYAAGSVTGGRQAGGLVGTNVGGTVGNSYSTASATGDRSIGGLVGVNGWGSDVSNSYSIGSVTGHASVGGLVGENHADSTVSDSFWDTETSGQATSAAGVGKTTAEMKSIATFSGAAWNVISVANPGTRNPSYVWNIAEGETYPFLSWQSVA